MSLWEIIAWFLAVPVGGVVLFFLHIIIHELGHVVLGLLCGMQVPAWGIGLGKVYFRLRLGNSVFYLAHKSPVQGIAFPIYPALQPPRWTYAVMVIGGGLFNAIAALLTAATFAVTGFESRWYPVQASFIALNALAAVGTLLPYSFRAGRVRLQTDGLLFIRMLRFGAAPTSPTDWVNTLASFGPLWRELGTTVHLRLALLLTADFWMDSGDRDRAGELLQEEEGLPLVQGTWEEYVSHYLRAGLRLQLGQYDQAKAEADRAIAQMPKNEAPNLAQGMARTRQWCDLGLNPASQLAALRDIRASADLEPDHRCGWLLTEARLSLEVNEGDKTRQLCEEYLSAPSPPAQQLHRAKLMLRYAQFLQAADSNEAQGFAEGAGTQFHLIAKQLHYPEDRKRFVAAVAATFEAFPFAQARLLGSETQKRPVALSLTLVDRAMALVGWLVGLFVSLFLAGFIAVELDMDSFERSRLIPVYIICVTSLAMVGTYALYHWPLVWFRDRHWARGGGWVLLIMGCGLALAIGIML